MATDFLNSSPSLSCRPRDLFREGWKFHRTCSNFYYRHAWIVVRTNFVGIQFPFCPSSICLKKSATSFICRQIFFQPLQLANGMCGSICMLTTNQKHKYSYLAFSKKKKFSYLLQIMLGVNVNCQGRGWWAKQTFPLIPFILGPNQITSCCGWFRA